MSELQEAKGALLDVLHQLQDPKSCVNDKGEFDENKATWLFKRANAVGEVTAQITQISRTQIESQRAQIEVVRMALDHGYQVTPEAMGLQLGLKKDA